MGRPHGKAIFNHHRDKYDILQHLADGKRYKEIGPLLSTTPNTVRESVQRTVSEFGVSTAIQAVAQAIRQELID